jgi:maltose/maltodextrin transport system substrate-binding protein/arabinogalactan oligomer/maltooligosaccharide transport system substrate-binding protein
MLTTVGVMAQDEGLLIWTDDTRAPIIEELGAFFTEELGIPVSVQQLGFGDIRDQLKTAGPAGEGPDIIIGAHDWLGELVANGLISPIALGDLAEDFTPASIQAFTFNGELYGLPYVTENVAFIYNPELVAEAPTTWEEVRTITEELVASGASTYGFVRQEGDPYHFYPIQTAFGGYIFGIDEDGNYVAEDLGVDNEGSIAALDWFASMVEDGYQPPSVDYDVMHALFESGDAAMIVTGPWALERIRLSGVPYAVTNIPSGPAGAGKPFLGVQAFMISAFSENQDIAESFLLDFVANPDIELTVTVAEQELTGTPLELLGLARPSAYIPALEATEDEDFVAFGIAGAAADPMPAIPEMSSVWTAWGDAVILVAQGQVTAEEAFTTAGEQIRTLIAQATE